MAMVNSSNPQETLDYINGRFKTYTFIKSELSDIHNKEDFEKLSEGLLDEIFSDTKFKMEIMGKNYPAIFSKTFMELEKYSNLVLDFFRSVKELRNY